MVYYKSVVSETKYTGSTYQGGSAMNCLTCGCEITPGAKFCRNCGTPVPAAAPAPEVKDVTETAEEIVNDINDVKLAADAEPVIEAAEKAVSEAAPEVAPAPVIEPVPAPAPAPAPVAAAAVAPAAIVAPTPAPAPVQPAPSFGAPAGGMVPPAGQPITSQNPYQPVRPFGQPGFNQQPAYAQPSLAKKRNVNYPLRIMAALFAVAYVVLCIVLGTGQFKDFNVDDFFKKTDFWVADVPIALFILFIIGHKVTDVIASIGFAGMAIQPIVEFFKEWSDDLDYLETGEKLQYLSSLVLYMTAAIMMVAICLIVASCASGSFGKGASVAALAVALYLALIFTLRLVGFFMVGFDDYNDDDLKMYDILDTIKTVVYCYAPVFVSIAFITEKKAKKAE